MFSFHDSAVPDLDFCGLSGEVYERHNRTAKADLNVVAIPRAEQRIGRAARADRQGITLIWEYSTDLFDRTTMERLVGHYLRLLAAAVAAPGARVGELPLLSAAERHQVTAGWNYTAGRRSSEALLHELFAEHAARAPEAVALVSDAGTVTYGELDGGRQPAGAAPAAAAASARRPASALCLERSPELVVAHARRPQGRRRLRAARPRLPAASGWR